MQPPLTFEQFAAKEIKDGGHKSCDALPDQEKKLPIAETKDFKPSKGQKGRQLDAGETLLN
jgi:hypothetical protein